MTALHIKTDLLMAHRKQVMDLLSKDDHFWTMNQKLMRSEAFNSWRVIRWLVDHIMDLQAEGTETEKGNGLEQATPAKPVPEKAPPALFPSFDDWHKAKYHSTFERLWCQVGMREATASRALMAEMRQWAGELAAHMQEVKPAVLDRQLADFTPGENTWGNAQKVEEACRDSRSYASPAPEAERPTHWQTCNCRLCEAQRRRDILPG